MTIRIYTTQTRLIIRIVDNGIGIEKELLKELQHTLELGLNYIHPIARQGKAHIALININQRIKLYFGEEYGLSISSIIGNGTTVTMSLPLQYYANNSGD